MKIQQLIENDRIFLDLEARELVQALAVVAERVGPDLGLAPRLIVESLLDRERLGSTSVGDGFAIPHSKIGDLKEIVVYVARFATPVDFGAADDQPVSFFFVVLSPPDRPAAHLQALSQIARILKRHEVRVRLLEAPDRRIMLEVLSDAAAAEGL